MAIDARFKQEIEKALKALDDFGEEFKDPKERRKMLRPAAKVLQAEIRRNAPRSEQAHKRYSTAKFDKKKRAPKGSGNVVATYYPGNLERSIAVLTFRRSAALFVGPRIAKRGKGGEFKGAAVDGYYAHFVEFGTKNMPPAPFVRPAADSARTQVVKEITEAVKKKVKEFEQKLK